MDTPVEKSAAELLVERAEAAARALRVENDRRQEMMARQALSGQAEAGIAPPTKKTPEEEQRERINQVLKGVGRQI